ncbi:hypothetical protein SCOR_04320 [Sulfidibacter corallicola]
MDDPARFFRGLVTAPCHAGMSREMRNLAAGESFRGIAWRLSNRPAPSPEQNLALNHVSGTQASCYLFVSQIGTLFIRLCRIRETELRQLCELLFGTDSRAGSQGIRDRRSAWSMSFWESRNFGAVPRTRSVPQCSMVSVVRDLVPVDWLVIGRLPRFGVSRSMPCSSRQTHLAATI